MVLIHSTRPALYSAPTPISMQLTVQLPPIQLRPPLDSAFLMTGRFTGSSTMTASSFMRSVEAASIQWPVPAGGAQLGEHLGGVVAALGGDDDVAALERVDVVGVLAASSRSSPSTAQRRRRCWC
jgi:hypothetical protein